MERQTPYTVCLIVCLSVLSMPLFLLFTEEQCSDLITERQAWMTDPWEVLMTRTRSSLHLRQSRGQLPLFHHRPCRPTESRWANIWSALPYGDQQKALEKILQILSYRFPSTRFSYHILCVCSSPFSLLQLHLMYLQCHHLLVCMRIEDTIKHKQYAVVLEVVVLHLLIFSSAFPSRHSFLQLKLFGSFNSLDWIDASSTESMVDT